MQRSQSVHPIMLSTNDQDMHSRSIDIVSCITNYSYITAERPRQDQNSVAKQPRRRLVLCPSGSDQFPVLQDDVSASGGDDVLSHFRFRELPILCEGTILNTEAKRSIQCTKLRSGKKYERAYILRHSDGPNIVGCGLDCEVTTPLEVDLVAGTGILGRNALRLRVIVADDPLWAR